MKIMIVDDEVIIRTGLSTVIDWQSSGFEMLAPAASAEEALLRIPIEQPDIVFTDIRMTGKSGLEMANEVKREYPETEIVVLSGYDEFTYAQQAMREGVSDYLLKTSRPDEIVASAVRASERIRHKRREEAQGREQQLVVKSKRLEQLLLAEQPPAPSVLEEVKRWYPMFQSAGLRYYVWLVAVSGREEGRRQDPLLLEAAGSMLQQLLAAESLELDGQIVLITSGDPAYSKREPDRVHGALAKAGEALQCDWFAACGMPAEDSGSLFQSYRTAKNAYEFRWFFQEQGIVGYGDVQHRKGIRSVCTEDEERVLASILKSCSRPDLNVWIRETLAKLRLEPDATPGSIRSYLHSLLIAGHRWLVRAADSVGYSGGLPDMTELKGQELTGLLDETLQQHLETLMDKYAEIVSGSNLSVKRAMAYIREHLHESLSLQQVARYVHMNPNYFSELFKRESGSNYIEYVTEERLKRAMALLSETPAKISEVAGRVGYSDIKHFNKLFKKYAGQTPSAYRGKR